MFERKIILLVFLFFIQFSFSQNIELKGKTWWVKYKKALNELEIGEYYEMYTDTSNRKSIDNTMYVEEHLFFNENNQFYFTIKGSYMNPYKKEPNLYYSNSGEWILISPNTLKITMEDGAYNRSIYFYKISNPVYNKVILERTE